MIEQKNKLILMIIILVIFIAIWFVFLRKTGEQPTGEQQVSLIQNFLNYFKSPEIGRDYNPGEDISCGQYDTKEKLAEACYKNQNCKGFSIWNDKPWCMKHTVNFPVKNPSHIFYLKK